MSDVMSFPETFEEFAKSYKIVDSKQVYTNGTELIPIFRVEQWLEHKSTLTLIDINNIKAAVIKEFVNRIRRRLNSNTPRGAYLINIVDNVVKEMAGETKMKYKKKPVVVEAIQFTQDNFPEVKAFTNGLAHNFGIPDSSTMVAECVIPTLEGDHIATEGDYIIKGVKGEFYPCKPDIFEQTYELVE